jgi:hypothetical protein
MTAHAERASVVVDAADYFAAAKSAILQARHAVFLIGWDFDTRIVLEPDDGTPGVPNTLGHFLSYVVRRGATWRSSFCGGTLPSSRCRSAERHRCSCWTG